MARNEWSDDELLETIKSYMEMLRLEKSGSSYSKAEFRRELISGPLANRSPGSIEFRMQNISSFRAQKGFDWIEGYKPMDHIGEGVARRLETLFDRFETSSQRTSRPKTNELMVGGNSSNSSTDFEEAPNDDLKELQVAARRIRRGQGRFRANLLEKYGNKCVITGEGPEEVLEAVHIVPHSESGVNELENGLLMRADVHHLFDDELLFIDPDSKRIKMDGSLKNTSYWQYHGREIRKRVDGTQITNKYLKERKP